MRLEYAAFVIACSVLLSSAGLAREQKNHEVVGTSDNTWKGQGKESPDKASVGKPDGRLTIKVKNGDTVVFKVEGGRHGVIFENGAVEMGNGVWEVVSEEDKKKLQPAKTLGKAYDAKKALATAPAGKSTDLLTIKIKNLKKGAENGILFGCNPHSKSEDGKDVEMLGVIVLDSD
jgi:hypothetical protein